VVRIAGLIMILVDEGWGGGVHKLGVRTPLYVRLFGGGSLRVVILVVLRVWVH
jgi:hypothetical protein